jgi:hypothetical protein
MTRSNEQDIVTEDDPIISIRIRLLPEMRETIKRQAAAYNMTVAAWMRQVLGLDDPGDL